MEYLRQLTIWGGGGGGGGSLYQYSPYHACVF